MGSDGSNGSTVEIREARWRMAVMDGRPVRSDTGAIDHYMTKRYQRVTRAIEELAALVSDDGIASYETDDDDDSLENLTGRIWDFMEAEMVAWAAPERHRARWERWREREARYAAEDAAASKGGISAA